MGNNNIDRVRYPYSSIQRKYPLPTYLRLRDENVDQSVVVYIYIRGGTYFMLPTRPEVATQIASYQTGLERRLDETSQTLINNYLSR